MTQDQIEELRDRARSKCAKAMANATSISAADAARMSLSIELRRLLQLEEQLQHGTQASNPR